MQRKHPRFEGSRSRGGDDNLVLPNANHLTVLTNPDGEVTTFFCNAPGNRAGHHAGT